MARKPTTAATEAAEDQDEINTGNAQSEDTAAPQKSGKVSRSKPMYAAFLGDPSEGDEAPQRSSIVWHGTRFRLGEEVDVSHFDDTLKAKLIGHSHFATSEDAPNKREKMGASIRRHADAAKAAKAARTRREKAGAESADKMGESE